MRIFRGIFGTLKELFQFLYKEGLWWLMPMIIILFVFFMVIIIGNLTGASPLIYTIF